MITILNKMIDCLLLGKSMVEKVSHNCGIVVAHTLHDVYSFIASLQHRGREAAGIAAIGDGVIDVIKWAGTVNTFDLKDLYKILKSSRYHTYMAHVRYATKGKKDRILQDAHPHVIGGTHYKMGNHLIFRDCEAAIVHNGTLLEESIGKVDRHSCKTGCDSEVMLHLLNYHMSEGEIMRTVKGSFTAAMAQKKNRDIIVMRDRTGMKPGVLGWKDGKFCVVSEDIALRKNGAVFKQDLLPGAIYYMHPDGTYDRKIIVDPCLRRCFFEYNYLADVETSLNGVSVLNIRNHLGEILAEEHPINADFVTYFPRCPEAAAERYAEVLGIPLEHLFYKMRGQRSFQGSTSEERRESIDENVHLNPEVAEKLRGKKGVVIDDSTVRANNIKREVYLLKQAGIDAVHLNYTPPLGIIGDDGQPRFCNGGGVDMTRDDNYIARGRTLEQISKEAGIQVLYISVSGMHRAFADCGLNPEELCTFCIGGPNPWV
jgi:amidophosphoribosyltransferase